MKPDNRTPVLYAEYLDYSQGERQPRPVTYGTRWLLMLGVVACVSMLVALWVITWGMA